jgi:peptidoglycan/LPS O-acetylase OafA/YrhL
MVLFQDWYIMYHLHKSLLAYLPFFMLGVLFAEYYLSRLNGNIIKKSLIWDIIGAAATLGLFVFHERPSNLFDILQLLMLFLVFVSVFKGKGLNWFYTRKFIYITGGMCYTIYLIHYGFIAFISDYTSRLAFEGSFLLNLLLQAVIILPLLYLVSSMFFALFEKPFMYKDWPTRTMAFFGFSKAAILKK